MHALAVKSNVSKTASRTILYGLWLAAAACAVAIFLSGDRLQIGYLSIVLLLLQLALAIPVGYAMISTSLLGLLAIGGYRVVAASVQSIVYDSVASWTYSVIPLFAFMGIAMWKSGVAGKAYAAAHVWTRRLPGGLAMATVLAGAGLASTSGSTLGITMALGKMSLSEMLRYRYKATIATGTIAMSGTLGQIIPPSVLLAIYAGIANVPVGPQLMAGLIPGLLLAAAFLLTILLWALMRPSAVPRPQAAGAGVSRLRATVGALPILILALLIIGGLASGIFTATEAAAVGAVLALFFGWLALGSGKRGPSAFGRYLKEVGVASSVSLSGLFLIIIGAFLFSRLITLSGAASVLTDWLIALDLTRVELLLCLIVFYIILGMFLESLPMMLLTVPLLAAPLAAAGVDMIWFGVFLVIMCEIGMVFPPIGMLTFVVHRLAQDREIRGDTEIKLTDVFIGVMPFVAATILITVALIIWPDIVMFLPDAMKN
jgi:tripartite ATP-independent transporter DctM subunit